MAKAPSPESASSRQEQRSYGAVFLVIGAMAAFSSLWMVYDEEFRRRPWKEYQAEFFDLEAEQAQSILDDADAVLASDATATRLAELEAAIAEAEASQESNAYQEAVRITAEWEQKIYDTTREMQFSQSVSDEDYYYFKHAQHEAQEAAGEVPPADPHHGGGGGHAGPVDEHHLASLQHHREDYENRYNATMAKIAEFQVELGRLESGMHVASAPVRANAALLDSLRGLHQKVFIPRENATRALDAANGRWPEVRQYVLPNFETNEFSQSIARIERCETCHMGINRAGFEDAPNPHSTHPNRKALLGNHPMETFGCTPCHQGDGIALTVYEGHGLDHYFGKPLLTGSHIEASCARCHDAFFEMEDTPILNDGRGTVEEFGCTGCHKIEGMSDRRIGPPLYHIGEKVHTEWLSRWLQDPESYLENARMPNFLFEEGEADAISAYLLSLSTPWDGLGTISMEGANAEAGQWVFENRGCQACHAIDGTGDDHAPDLTKAGEKLDPEWVAAWAYRPKHYNPDASMPSLRLTKEEARDVAAFVTSHGSRNPRPELDARYENAQLINDGKTLVGTYGCFGCHLIEGMEERSRIGVELTGFGSKAVDLLDFGDRTDLHHDWNSWTQAKLEWPRTFETERVESRMPIFPFHNDPKKVEAVLVFLKSRTGLSAPEGFEHIPTTAEANVEAGAELLRRYNCQGCHLIDGSGGEIGDLITAAGMAPPILTGEGDKVQPSWFYEFLQHPHPIRPWLDVRMPSFEFDDDEASTIVNYFLGLEDRTRTYVNADDKILDPASVAMGRRLLPELQCLQCHVDPALAPNKAPSELAPNLVMAKDRLQPDWIMEWVWYPDTLQPGTKMPSFFYSDGDTLWNYMYDDIPSDVALRALRDAIHTLEPEDVETFRGG